MRHKLRLEWRIISSILAFISYAVSPIGLGIFFEKTRRILQLNLVAAAVNLYDVDTQG